MPLDPDVLDAVQAEHTDEGFPWLCVIDHPDLDDPIRITTYMGDWTEDVLGWTIAVDHGVDNTFTGVFVWAPFDIQPPGESDRQGRAKMAIPNVSPIIGEQIEALDGPATVALCQVLRSDRTVIVRGPFPAMLLQDVTVDAERVEGDLRFVAAATETIPQGAIRPSKYRTVGLATA